ncbi:hypothetical protein BDB00DRAFT_795781 [Zychaea mexicana]|uniref:uncharacterized protein n=1 Tax=Zychaea mexicana TaxID=64656 RepID=UPI0022FE197F|nr:uncharacterized protein BDB00DRAFT_795781 [Zychaea mexicana]KAI9499193.1 hypothetical protein BDB00DRAFT_795781 [Zychaea mexicana]
MQQQPITFLIFSVIFLFASLVRSVPLAAERRSGNDNGGGTVLSSSGSYLTDESCQADLSCILHCLLNERFLLGECNKETHTCECTSPLFHDDIQKEPKVIVVPAGQDGSSTTSSNGDAAPLSSSSDGAQQY